VPQRGTRGATYHKSYWAASRAISTNLTSCAPSASSRALPRACSLRRPCPSTERSRANRNRYWARRRYDVEPRNSRRGTVAASSHPSVVRRFRRSCTDSRLDRLITCAGTGNSGSPAGWTLRRCRISPIDDARLGMGRDSPITKTVEEDLPKWRAWRLLMCTHAAPMWGMLSHRFSTDQGGKSAVGESRRTHQS